MKCIKILVLICIGFASIRFASSQGVNTHEQDIHSRPLDSEWIKLSRETYPNCYFTLKTSLEQLGKMDVHTISKSISNMLATDSLPDIVSKESVVLDAVVSYGALKNAVNSKSVDELNQKESKMRLPCDDVSSKVLLKQTNDVFKSYGITDEQISALLSHYKSMK
jgi:hypothetical protein